MPQVVLKNVSREDYERLSKEIAECVAQIIEVPIEHIVVEHSETSFFRNGVQDNKSAMVWIYWKRRTKEYQKQVAQSLSKILLGAGYQPVEIVYQNLDMSDFYEYQ